MPDHLLTETVMYAFKQIRIFVLLEPFFGSFVIVFGCTDHLCRNCDALHSPSWKAFLQYLRAGFTTEGREIKLELAKILAFALEFKLGGEILRPSSRKNMNELYMLGAVILLRSFLTLVIHYEIKFESD